MSRTLKVIAWNVYVGHRPAHVREMLNDLIDTHNPDVFVLSEAKNLYGELAGLGYEVIHFAPRAQVQGNHSETGNIAILVREDIKVIRRGALRMETFWRGPKHGHPHDPRVFRTVRLRKGKQVWKLGGFHFPFGDAAKAEADGRTREWFTNTAPGRPVIGVGDMNMRARGLRKRIARWVRALVAGTGIDLAIFRDCKLVKTRDLGKLGSDHPAKLFIFEVG